MRRTWLALRQCSVIAVLVFGMTLGDLRVVQDTVRPERVSCGDVPCGGGRKPPIGCRKSCCVTGVRHQPLDPCR